MPNAHFDVQVISRGGGHRRRSAVGASAYRSGTKVAALAVAGMLSTSSVVASAAYRSGETLYDQQADRVFDYTRKEDVLHQEILTPQNAPVWAADRQLLWNRVEASEKRKDAQLARDIIAALPRELNTEQQIALVREFVQSQFVSQGMIADIAIHDKEASDGGRQPHTHIMLTMRDVSPDGFGKKNREWNKRTHVTGWRQAWEEITNRHLAAAGREERLSLRSYKEQGIDKTPGEHMGYDAWHLEQKGTETGKGDRNRAIDHDNLLSELASNYAPPEPLEDAEQQDYGTGETEPQDAGLILSSATEQMGTDDSSDTVHSSRMDDRLLRELAASGQAALDDGEMGETVGRTALSDAQLEAMHRASLRIAVSGLLRQSAKQVAQQVAERISRLRTYGRAILDKTIDVARSIFDRYAANAMRNHAQDRHGAREDRER